MDIDDISNAYFNILDVENTLSKKTKAMARRHGGTENEDTIGELLSDIKNFILTLENEQNKEKHNGH